MSAPEDPKMKFLPPIGKSNRKSITSIPVQDTSQIRTKAQTPLDKNRPKEAKNRPRGDSFIPNEYVAMWEELRKLPKEKGSDTREIKGDIDVETFLNIVKEKETFSKELEKVETIFNMRNQEKTNVSSMNSELETKLTRLSKETAVLSEKKGEQEKRTDLLKDLEQEIEQERVAKETTVYSRIQSEETLDSINAEIATLSLVKRVLENKLERIAEEKNFKIKEKQQMYISAEEDRNSYVAQIQHLLRHKETQQEIHKSISNKAGVLKTENEALESQLEKAKNQVTLLIQQISKFDAKAAKELKAEKIAKETAKRTKYPTGNVTICFSDVQCSTYQWEHFPQLMGEAIELHNNIMRANLKTTGGYEVKTEGDSFMVAFHSPVSAVWWTLFVQEGLLNAPWPPGLFKSPYAGIVNDDKGNVIYRGLRVRMGIHIGKPECKLDPITGRMDYFGGMVNRAARISSIASGGQILISSKVWDEVKREVNDVFSEHQGEHYLKGLKSPESLLMILPKAIATRTFPKLNTSADKVEPEQEVIKFQEYEDTEEAADQAYATDENTTEKLSAIVSEIEVTLKAQQEKQQLKDLNKQISQLKKQITEIQELISQTKAEEEVLKYQIETSRKKNIYYEQDISHAKTDGEVCLDLIRGFEKEKEQSSNVIIGANAKIFCLLIRQNLLESQLLRTHEETNMLEKQIKNRESEESNSTTEANSIYDRIQLQENHMRQLKNENEFYVSQIQELEKNLTQIREAKKQTPEKKPEKIAELLQKQKLLEEALDHEVSTRDEFSSKVKKYQEDIESLEDTLKPVVLKKLKVLEHELIQVKGEKDILETQIDSIGKQYNEDIDKENKQLEKFNGKVVSLKKKNMLFEKRLAKLTHRDYNITLDEHVEKIRRMMEEFLSSHLKFAPAQEKTWTEDLTEAQMETIEHLLAGEVVDDSQLASVGVEKSVIEINGQRPLKNSGLVIQKVYGNVDANDPVNKEIIFLQRNADFQSVETNSLESGANTNRSVESLSSNEGMTQPYYLSYDSAEES